MHNARNPLLSPICASIFHILVAIILFFPKRRPLYGVCSNGHRANAEGVCRIVIFKSYVLLLCLPISSLVAHLPILKSVSSTDAWICGGTKSHDSPKAISSAILETLMHSIVRCLVCVLSVLGVLQGGVCGIFGKPLKKRAIWNTPGLHGGRTYDGEFRPVWWQRPRSVQVFRNLPNCLELLIQHFSGSVASLVEELQKT